jgi:ferredoxin
MRVRVDADRCIGSGQCALTAPGVFDQDDIGIVLLLQPEPPAEREREVRRAEQGCPVQAITIESATGGETS